MTPDRWSLVIGAFIGAVAGLLIGVFWIRPHAQTIAEASVWLAELRKADNDKT